MDAAEPQRNALGEGVHVDARADAHHGGNVLHIACEYFD